MFFIDDILFSPMTSLFWLFREIHNAVEQEFTNDAEQITAALSDLYMQLETGQITEAEFDEQEAVLLDRLSELEASEASSADDESEDEDDDEDDDDDDDDDGDEEDEEGEDTESDESEENASVTDHNDHDSDAVAEIASDSRNTESTK